MASQSLAHWVKDLLTKARIDMEMFTAQSTKGATISVVLKRRLHIKGIFEVADWSGESTFNEVLFPFLTGQYIHKEDFVQ